MLWKYRTVGLFVTLMEWWFLELTLELLKYCVVGRDRIIDEILMAVVP